MIPQPPSWMCVCGRGPDVYLCTEIPTGKTWTACKRCVDEQAALLHATNQAFDRAESRRIAAGAEAHRADKARRAQGDRGDRASRER